MTEEKIRLLLVDDDHAMLDATQRALAGRGFWVHQAHNAQAAMCALSHHSFDLVVLDVKLASDDGINVFEHIRCVYPELPVVLVFTHGTARAALENTREGVFACLPRPCTIERLDQIARRAVGSAAMQPVAALGGARRPQLQLLVVDEDSALQRFLSVALPPRNIRVTASSSGSEAQRLVERRRFDVAMMEFRLPDMDGLDLLRWIKQTRPSMGALFLTDHPSMPLTLEGERAGACDVLVKPQGPDILAFHLRRALLSTGSPDRRERTAASMP